MSGLTHITITKKAVEFEVETGRKPTKVYLGRLDVKALLIWAHANQYIGDPEKAEIEGDNRPEVSGLLVYQVNEDSHLEIG